MRPHREAFSRGELSEAELTGIYVISILSFRSPGDWLGARRPSLALPHELDVPLSLFHFEPNVERRLENFSSLGEVFNNFALKSTPESVNRALLSWSSGKYGLILMFHVPSPAEVLELQSRGKRVVSMICEPRRASSYILGERDALSFTMHDLVHADHFFLDSDRFEGQLGFYGLLAQAHQAGHFTEALEHPGFAREFEYLIADMNAYAIHLLKCLKAAFEHYFPSSFEGWVQRLTVDVVVLEALRDLNCKSYDENTSDALLLDWLKTYRSPMSQGT